MIFTKKRTRQLDKISYGDKIHGNNTKNFFEKLLTLYKFMI